MAKDRFSKFKKSFYSSEFRYGIDTLFEKNKSFNSTAIWTYNIRSKYSRNVPMDKIPTACFCSFVSFCTDTFKKLMMLINYYNICYYN